MALVGIPFCYCMHAHAHKTVTRQPERRYMYMTWFHEMVVC